MTKQSRSLRTMRSLMGLMIWNIGLRIASKSRSRQSKQRTGFTLPVPAYWTLTSICRPFTLNQQGMLYAPRTNHLGSPFEQGFMVRTKIDSRAKTETYRFNPKWFINSAGLGRNILPRLSRICPHPLFPNNSSARASILIIGAGTLSRT